MRNYLIDTIVVENATGPAPESRRMAVQDKGVIDIVDLLKFDK